MKAVILAAAVVLAPAEAAAQRQQAPPQRVKAELLKKLYTTKIPIANVLIVPEGSPDGSVSSDYPRNRLVDTNVFASGVRYNLRDKLFYAPAGSESVTCNANSPGYWADRFVPGQLCVVKAGRTVRVDSVDLNNDRMEVWLTTIPEGAYAKLKFMFGKDWQKTMAYDAIMEGVSAGLRIESIERARTVSSEYTRLTGQLQRLDAVTVGVTPDKRLEHAVSLRSVLKGLISNREDHQALGKGSATAEISRYNERLRSVEATIPNLETEAREYKLDALRRDLAQSVSASEAYRKKSSTPPRSLEQHKALEQVFEEWEVNLTERAKLQKELSALEDPSASKAAEAIERDRAELEKRRDASAGLRTTLEAAELNSAYAKLKGQENRLQGDYVAAFGTPKQRDAAARFRAHLQAMIANRETAQRRGLPGAAAEIQRLRNKLSGLK